MGLRSQKQAAYQATVKRQREELKELRAKVANKNLMVYSRQVWREKKRKLEVRHREDRDTLKRIKSGIASDYEAAYDALADDLLILQRLQRERGDSAEFRRMINERRGIMRSLVAHSISLYRGKTTTKNAGLLKQARALKQGGAKPMAKQQSMFGGSKTAAKKKPAAKKEGKLIPGAPGYARGCTEAKQRAIVALEREFKKRSAKPQEARRVLDSLRAGNAARFKTQTIKNAVKLAQGASAKPAKKPAAKKSTAKKPAAKKPREKRPNKGFKKGDPVGVKGYERKAYTVTIPAKKVGGYKRKYSPAGQGDSYSTKRRRRGK